MISPYMPRGEYQPRPGELPPKDRIKQTLESLEQGIDAILSSEGFAAYLRILSRFHAYSFSNVALIYLQRPDATQVAGYRAWQQLGRQVKRGETGITILVPHRRRIEAENEDDDATTIVRSFGVGTVFDVAQTDGDPLPAPPIVEPVSGASDAGMRLYVDLIDYLGTRGVSVTRERTEPANGYFQPTRNHVGIGYHIDGDQAVKTLMHETAHVVAGHTLGMNDRDVETVAESAAFVVLNRCGIDSSGYTFPYVARWAQDRAVFKRNVDAIQKTAHTILDGLAGEWAQVVEAGVQIPLHPYRKQENAPEPESRARRSLVHWSDAETLDAGDAPWAKKSALFQLSRAASVLETSPVAASHRGP